MKKTAGIFTIVGLLLVAGCQPRQAQVNPKVEDKITSTEPDPGDSYRDSISMITGIAPESPYWYDPAWDIHISAAGDTLFYYPCERKAAYYTIPSSIRVIDERAFQCNQELKEIIVPEGVEEIGVGAFLSCQKLQIVAIRGRIAEIPWRAFDDCPALVSVEIPYSVKSISGMAFCYCTKLSRIAIRNPEPPTLEGAEADEDDPTWSFAGVNTDKCLLQVPAGSVKKYRSAPGWNRFKHIEGNLKPIPHRWVDLDSSIFAGTGITQAKVREWKRFFERSFSFDEWDAAHMKYYVNEDRYLAVKDLQNLWCDDRSTSIDRTLCTLWRLMQYCARNHVEIPSEEDRQARLMRIQMDSVLTYTALSNADAGVKNDLEENLLDWYYSFLSSQIQGKCTPALKVLLAQEDSAWNDYHDKALRAFQTISDSSGSGFHNQLFRFAIKNLELRRIGVDAYYTIVFPEAKRQSVSVKKTLSSEEAVIQGYKAFLQNLPDWGDWPFSAPQEMKASLSVERQGWEKWMAVREAISGILPSYEKEVWDNATGLIRHQKQSMLNRNYDIY